MQSKLFVLLFLIVIFSLNFASNDTKRKRQPKKNILNPPDKNTQENYLPNTFQPSISDLQKNNTIFSNLLKRKEEEENSNIPFNLLRTQKDTDESSSVPSELLNKLSKKPNIFRYIFTYLSFCELEFKLKRTSNVFYHSCQKFLQEEKNLLKERLLKNKGEFLESIKNTKVYFDFFEKKHWSNRDETQYTNVDCFSEDLILLPNCIKQINWFDRTIDWKYVLFKNGHFKLFKGDKSLSSLFLPETQKNNR